MTLLKRSTLVDRPELIDRDEDSEEDEAETEKQQTEDSDTGVQQLGKGGDVQVNNIEFSESDLDIVGAANTAAVLTTGQDSGEVYEQMFANASVQLKDMKERDIDISSIFEFGLANSFATVGVSDKRAAEMVEILTEPQETRTSDSDQQISTSTTPEPEASESNEDTVAAEAENEETSEE